MARKGHVETPLPDAKELTGYTAIAYNDAHVACL